MSIDTSYILSNAIGWIISFIVFFISFRIYKNTQGASLAYKKWAIATFLILMATTVYIISGLTIGGKDKSKADIKEIHKIIGFTIIAF